MRRPLAVILSLFTALPQVAFAQQTAGDGRVHEAMATIRPEAIRGHM
jgi:hypothetical protein